MAGRDPASQRAEMMLEVVDMQVIACLFFCMSGRKIGEELGRSSRGWKQEEASKVIKDK